MIVHNVEQQTPEWFELRLGLPTSSTFSELVTPTGKASKSIEPYGVRLALEKHLGRELGNGFVGNKHTERGNALEPFALDYYQEDTGSEITPVGFITDDLMRYGCSTDGLVGTVGAVEAKCLSDINHYKALRLYKEKGESDPKYTPQTQGEILVPSLEWVDMIFYHPDMESFIVRIEPIPEYQDMLKGQLAEVLKIRNEHLNFLEN